MTVLGTKVSRKRMLMRPDGLFIVGNLLSALAPAFAVVLIGRVVASLAARRLLRHRLGRRSAISVAPDKKAGPSR